MCCLYADLLLFLCGFSTALLISCLDALANIHTNKIIVHYCLLKLDVLWFVEREEEIACREVSCIIANDFTLINARGRSIGACFYLEFEPIFLGCFSVLLRGFTAV